MASSSLLNVSELLKKAPPPDPLATGWILRNSRSQPGTVYFYNQETGESSWEQPAVLLNAVQESLEKTTTSESQQKQQQESETKQETVQEKEVASVKKRPAEPAKSSTSHTKRSKTTPKEVRVLHILKKHKDSRRPASWRNANITCTQEEAENELTEILTILKESQTPAELRATMEELARTESDCSSAKRGGDLGFFGKKKMQPAFEQASFALDIGELSDIIETSSGVHIILRIG